MTGIMSEKNKNTNVAHLDETTLPSVHEFRIVSLYLFICSANTKTSTSFSVAELCRLSVH